MFLHSNNDLLYYNYIMENIENMEKKIEVLQYCLNDLVTYFSMALDTGENYKDFHSFMKKYLDFNTEYMKELEDENNEEFLTQRTLFADEYADMIMKMVVNRKSGRKTIKQKN